MKPQPHTSGALPWALLAVPVLYLAALLASRAFSTSSLFSIKRTAFPGILSCYTV